MDYKSQISIREAISLVQESAPTMAIDNLALTEAYGRTLAEDIASQVDHPSCDNSALDGFACRQQDTLSATEDQPLALKLVGDVPAGSVFAGVVGPGEAVGIYTGAPVPEGADAIVAVEDTHRDGDTVYLKRPARPQDIRLRAQDITAGQVYLRSGMLLDEAAVGVAASMGFARLPVRRRPRVGILATGDEVIEPGQPIRDGQVFNSNSYSVAGLVKRVGAEAVMLPRAVDQPDVLRDTLAQHGGVDLLVTSGGVSMGNYDFVRDLVFDEGKVHFWKVAIRPGGPALFGEWQGIPIFGLPGNPVSSMVVFYLLTSAWVYRALQSDQVLPYDERVHALALSNFKGAGFKEAFRRCVLQYDSAQQAYTVTTTGNQSSGILTSMLYGNALAIVPPHQHIDQGEMIEVIKL